MTFSARILLVDDDPHIRTLAATLIEQEFPDYKCVEVADGNGLALALEGEVDLVVTDYQLGWTDGLDVFRQVKARRPDCPVIMFTGTGSEEIAVEAMKAGLDDYVLKAPKHIVRLPAAIRMALEQAERRRTLRATEARYRSVLDVLDTSAVAVLTLDADWTVIWANVAFERYFGLPRDRVIGQNKRQLLRDTIRSIVDQPADFADRILRTYEDRDCIASFACHIPAGEGREERWLEHRSLPILTGPYAGGRIEHYYDITERTRAEEARREQELRLRTILETASDGIHILDKAGNVVLANRAFRDMLGYTEAEAARLNVADWEAQWMREEVRARLDRLTGAQRFETRHRRRDGTMLDVEINAARVEVGDETFWYAASRDITERKRTEARLADAMRQQDLLLTSLPVVVYRARLTGDHGATWISDNVMKVTGFAPACFTGDSAFWLARVHPEDRARVLQETAAGVSRGAYAYEYRWRCADETYHWFTDRAVVVTDADGRPQELVGVWLDVSTQKRSEERFKTIFDQAPLGMALIDSLTGQIYAVNAKFAQIAGRPVEEMTRIDWMSITHPDDVQKDLDNMARLNAGEIAGFQMEKRYLLPAGGAVWINMTIAPVTVDNAGQPRHLCMIEDITERKRTAVLLAATTSRLNAVVRAAPIAITVLDLEGRVQLWNPAAQELFQWSEAEVIGQRLPTVPPDRQAEHRDIRARACRGEVIRDLEVIRRRKDGSPVTIALSIVLLRDEAGAPQGLLGMMEDVTERKLMEAQALRIERVTALGQLLSGIAHEIKNPLFVATGYMQLIREKLAVGEYERVVSDAQKVEEAMKRITRTTQQFLDLAKPAEQRMEPCNVSAVLEETLVFLAGELTKNRIRVETALAPDLPAVQADPKRMGEMFINLILNAIHAMVAAHGRGTLTVSVALVTDAETRSKSDAESAASPRLPVSASAAEGSWIEVRIQDDGPGIPPEHRARLFEPFFSTKPPEQGTGLGLWTVRAFVMGLKGQVTCETDAGQGATFIVRLPVAASPPQPASPLPSGWG